MKWAKSDVWHKTDGERQPRDVSDRRRRQAPWVAFCGAPCAGELFDEPADDTPRCPMCGATPS